MSISTFHKKMTFKFFLYIYKVFRISNVEISIPICRSKFWYDCDEWNLNIVMVKISFEMKYLITPSNTMHIYVSMHIIFAVGNRFRDPLTLPIAS